MDEPVEASPQRYREAHLKRLSWMPWLYFTLKPKHRVWAEPWQADVQRRLMEEETVEMEPGCFVSPDAAIFAERGKPIRMARGCTVAALAFLHGPLTLGEGVSVNSRASLDGGTGGIVIGAGTRIATGASLYAFNHGLLPERQIAEQPVTSRGIRIGADVWIGAHACITDGVTIADHAVVGAGAVVTRDVPEWAVVAGVPARVIADRRNRPSE